MRLTADFLIQIAQLQELSANDNRIGDADFTVRNIVTAELTYALARFARDEGVP